MLVTNIIRQRSLNIEVDCKIRAFVSLPERYNIVVLVKYCNIATQYNMPNSIFSKSHHLAFAIFKTSMANGIWYGRSVS